MPGFVHLHLHSEYSLLDGACKIKELVSKVKLMGQNAVAVTDHGVMYGIIDFYKQAKKEGIKPIIGCEVYVARRTRFDRDFSFDRGSFHLVLLCKDDKGYQNLMRLVSEAWISGFYGKPRVDKDLLKKYSEGLIALSACLAGEIPRLLLANDYSGAKKVAGEYREIFGQENFFLEIQDHNLSEQKQINPLIVKLSQETNIPLVATNDCHYINSEDSHMHKVLLCIQTNQTINDKNSFEFQSDQFYVKNQKEMEELFDFCPEAIENTQKIADRCNVNIEFGNTKLPRFSAPDGKDNFEYFKEKCYAGLKKYYGQNPEKAVLDRLEYELSTIKSMGYVDYYLIVQDFVNYAKESKIPVGPGRGSGAGSLAAYCIGITGIDPLKYNLLFERFLNPERVSMPDFDIDFCYERRQEVIDYVIKKYGKDHVSQIVTFGTMAARAAIKDVGRAMDIPYATTDSISKLVPSELGMTLDKALDISFELKEIYRKDEKMQEFIDMARKVEGMPRHASTHAAGVVITDKPVYSYVPLAKNDDSVVAQYTMTLLEELGLLKMDFLGLRTLTVISHTESMIKSQNPNFDTNSIEEEKEVYDMLSRGETDGVFQFESTGMKNIISQLKPEKMEDLIAVISLYRPGPMDSIQTYIENKHNPEKIKYLHPKLSKILDVTYGCIIYQEQVMQIFRELAGYSAGRADIVRRAMSKKKADVMEKEKNVFINGLKSESGEILVEGCLKRGVSKDIAEKIFSQMESFAAYAFNKSHAAAYALISYKTAWLKCKYPKEFMASLLTSVLNFSDKIFTYISQCRRMGIEVLPPSVNESEKNFTVSGNKIRFGLGAIKAISDNFISKLLDERKQNGEFKSFYSFCERMYGQDFNKRLLENLIKSGAFDMFKRNRRQMLSVVEKVVEDLSKNKKKNIEGQIGFFQNIDSGEDDEIDFPSLDEFPRNTLLAMEKEIVKMYISGHPLLDYFSHIDKRTVNKVADIFSENSDSNRQNRVKIKVVISSVKLKITKNNSTMAFLKVEDLTGTIEVIVFPKVFSEYNKYIHEENLVTIRGVVKSEDEGECRIICDKISDIDEDENEEKIEKKEKNLENETKNKEKLAKGNRNGLYLKLESENSEEYKKSTLLLSIFEGTTPVYMFFEDKKSLKLTPRSMWVHLNDVLVNELKNQIGEKNVAIKT